MKMTRVALTIGLPLLLATVGFLSGRTLGRADAFEIALPSRKIALDDGPVRLELHVIPPQPDLTTVAIETVVDVTGNAVASDVSIEGDGATFVATLEALPAGLYKMKVSAGETSQVLPFKVTIPVEVASATLNGLELTPGERIEHQTFSSGSGDALRVEVALENPLDRTRVTAHQAFLRFTHVQDQVETYFVLTPDATTKIHAVTLAFATLSKKFGYKSGDHRVQLLIGDASFARAIVWDLGVVELILGAAPPVAPSPLYAKPLLHESDTTLKPLREITHMMRPPAPRPPVVVSLVFTAAVLLPLAAFLVFTLALGMNVAKFGSVFVVGGLFVASLGAIFALFAWYWIELTMFQTLGYLAPLGGATGGFGLLTLKRLAHMGKEGARKPKQE